MEAISFNSIQEDKLNEVIARHFTRSEEKQTYKDITFDDLENIIPVEDLRGFEPNLIMDAERDEDAKRIEARMRIDSEIARIAIKNKSGAIVCQDSSYLYIEH